MSGFFKAIGERPIYILWIYLALINLALFLIMGIDKSLARHGKRRVPEATLFLLSVIGGSVGGILGMLAFRHKTKHASFVIGFPAIFIIQLVIAYFLAFRT